MNEKLNENNKPNQIEEIFSEKDKNIYNVTFIDIFISFVSQQLQFLPIFKMSAKSKMIQYGMEKLNQHLEINYIIDKLLELEKLKKLLLNYEQMKLFELVPKPIIWSGYFSNKLLNKSELTKTHIFHANNKNIEEKINNA